MGKDKLFLGVAVIIISLAAFLRLFNLNALPIFADEAIYVRWSQVMRAESSLRFLPLSDGKQPLFMWVTIPFLKIISDPLVAGRTLSALVGLGTVIGIAVASFLVFPNRRQATIAAVIAAVLPYLVFFDRMALADSMLAMFLIWTFNFSLLSLVHQRLDLAIFAGFTLGFAWLTKSPAIFAFPLLPLGLLFLPKYTLKNILFTIFYLLFTFAIAIGMYNILRLGPEFHQIALRNKDYVFPISEVLKRPTDPFIPHLKDSWHFYLSLATPVGLGLVIWGVFADKFSHWRQRLVLFSWWAAPIFIQSAIAKQFTARYLLFTVPFAVLLMAHAIEHIGQHTQKHLLVPAITLLVLLSSLWIDYTLLTDPTQTPLPRIERSGYLEEWTAGQGIKQIADQLRQYATQGPVLVGSEGFFGTPFNALQLYLNDVTNVRVIGVGVWIDSVHEKLKNSLSDNQVFLVVNSTRLHADSDKIGLKLIESFPKAIRPDNTQEHTLFFKVEKP